MKALFSFYEKFTCNVEFFEMKTSVMFSIYFTASKNLISVGNDSTKIFVLISKDYVFNGVLEKQD